MEIRKHMKKYTSISFTAHKKNYKTFKKVVSIAKKAKVNKVWTDRLIPIGGAKELVKISLNQKENKKFFKTVYKLMIKTKETQVTMSRALQFLQTGEMYSRNKIINSYGKWRFSSMQKNADSIGKCIKRKFTRNIQKK